MYMFFWFFKQLYYLTRKAFKHGFLILFVFFVFFVMTFIYKGAFAFDIEYNGQTIVLPDIPFDTELHPQYYISWSTGDSFYQLAYPQTEPATKFFVNTAGAYGNKVQYAYNSNGDTGHWIYYNYNPNGNFTWGNAKTTSGYSIIWSSPRYSTDNIYTAFDSNEVWYAKTEALPVITTTSSSIVDFSFNYLTIDANLLPFDDSYELRFTYPNNNTRYTGIIDSYKSLQNNHTVFNIPKSFFTNDIVVRTGSIITFDLLRYHRSGTAVTSYDYSLASYTLSLTSQQEQEINEDSDKQLLSDINNNQQQTNEKLDDINDTLTDSNLADDSVFFPTLDVPDLVQDGLTHIFDAFVLAFCSDTPQDIVVPFPFTNKTFTIQANYTRSMLNTYSPFLLALIEVIWWYHISKIVILDLADKGDKLRSGNIESMQTFNITTKIL